MFNVNNNKTKSDQSCNEFPPAAGGVCCNGFHCCAGSHERQFELQWCARTACRYAGVKSRYRLACGQEILLKSSKPAELAAKIAAAADGGKTAIAEKNHQKEVVAKLLVQLAHYVEANCKDDITIFLSSGFTPAASTKNTTPPVSESIRKIEPGPNSGQMLVTLMKFPGAASYLVQWAPVGAEGAPGSWTTKPAAAVRPPVLISGLTPGTTYVFQARAVTKTGYSDWSESVTRIAV